MLAGDLRSLIEAEVFSTLLLAMVHQLGLSSEHAAAYATFFNAARPLLGRGDHGTILLSYGETDTPVVKLERAIDGIPFAVELEWWPAAPVVTPSALVDPPDSVH